MATTLTITAKGQITLRKSVLQKLGLKPGDKVVVEPLPGSRIALSAVKRKGRIEDFFGVLKPKDGFIATDEQIQNAIEQGWMERWNRFKDQ